jgi:uncharacterized membrane protein HdeD (DUF308 family)
MATSPAFGAASVPHLPLARALGDNWWLLLLRGIVAITFGVLAFAWPGLTFVTLVIFWGAFTGADGILALVAAFSGKGSQVAPRWWLILVGLAGVAVGTIAFVEPVVAAGALLILIAVWAIVIGASQIIGGFALRKEIDGEWWLVLSGLLGILFGAAVLVQPIAGAFVIIWLIGTYALLFGLCLVMLSFRVRRLKKAD